MTDPRFSVVLPTRDRPGRLQAAAESVLEQTLPDLELWIVDDGSDPRTGEVCDRLGTDPRVHVLRDGTDTGGAAARNRGLARARGEYVAFIDDDCAWHPERLERVDRELRHRRSGPDYLCTQTVLIRPGPPPSYSVAPILPEGEAPWRVGTPMIVARRELLAALGGFDERLPRGHDWDLAVRLVDAGSWALLPEPLVWADDVPGLTADRAALRRASRVLARKYGRTSPIARDLTFRLHRSLSHKLLVHSHWRQGVRHALIAVRLGPGRVRAWAGLLAALPGLAFYRWLTGLAASRHGGGGHQ